MITPELEQAINKCLDCRVWDPENQPSVRDKLVADPEAYAGRVWVTIRTGSTLTFPGLPSIPLWVEIITCAAHQQEVEAADADA